MSVLLFYSVAVEDVEVDAFLQRAAPGDVRDTLAWLSANGYALSAHRGDSTFGAQFVYTGGSKVVVTVDRSQWMLDVAARPDAETWQYDLLIAAQAGQPYGDVFPTVGARSVADPLPEQLPESLSWRETLPRVLEWVGSNDVRAGVEQARRERADLTWS